MVLITQDRIMLEGCIKNYLAKGEAVILSNGLVVGFEDNHGRTLEVKELQESVLHKNNVLSTAIEKDKKTKNIQLEYSTKTKKLQLQNFVTTNKNVITIPVARYDQLNEAETLLEAVKRVVRSNPYNLDKVLSNLLDVYLEGENE